MMKQISLCTKCMAFSIFSVFCSLTASAQNLKAVAKVVDVGQVQYLRPVQGVFELKNTGKKNVRITNVDTGCGCAVASFSDKEVAAGRSVSMGITYDARMMGHFDKVIEVTYDNMERPLLLELKGVVVAEVEEYAGELPFELGNLTADCNYVEFENVRKGEVLQQKFHISNPTAKAVRPQVMHLPDFLTAEVSPSVVAPHKTAEITLTLDSKRMRDYGLTQTRVFLGSNPGERVSADKEIGISVVLLPAVNVITEAEKAMAPTLAMSAYEVSLPVADGKKKSATIEMQNIGKSVLEIQNLQMFTEGIQLKLNKRELKPGESAKLKITVVPKEMKRLRTNPRVLMITNDPDNPKVILRINTK